MFLERKILARVHTTMNPCVNSMPFKVWPIWRRPSNSSGQDSPATLPRSQFDFPRIRTTFSPRFPMKRGDTFLAFWRSSSVPPVWTPSSGITSANSPWKSSHPTISGPLHKHFPTTPGRLNTWLKSPRHPPAIPITIEPSWFPETLFNAFSLIRPPRTCCSCFWVFQFESRPETRLLDLLSQRINATISDSSKPSWKCPPSPRKWLQTQQGNKRWNLFALVLARPPGAGFTSTSVPGSARFHYPARQNEVQSTNLPRKCTNWGI